ncbi:MAG: helix-turn-helix domain-containing protein [Micrococcales bacterium]|nr:helix-turn-helix domain-containing protein [Micrococcales bacterium]
MNEARKRRLQSLGWRFGNAKEFLRLSDEEAAFVELKIELAQALRGRRKRHRLSQVGLARLLGSSQSRVAKMEAGDPSVSMDLLVRALLALGVSRRELARVFAAKAA